MGFEAAPFKFPLEYVEVLGGLDSEPFNEFKKLFREGFEVARKHCDSIISKPFMSVAALNISPPYINTSHRRANAKGYIFPTPPWVLHALICGLKDSALPCFAAFGEQTSQLLRDRFQQGLPHSAVGDHVDRLIMSSMGSAWTRLYDSVSAFLPWVPNNPLIWPLQFQYYSQSIL